MGILFFLFSVCLIVFYSSFKYGFVSDDYNRITIHSWNQLFEAWRVVNLRRPLDELYYFSFYKLFGYNPLPYRLFLLGVYVLNSFLVYRLIRSVTKNQMIGVLVAILFAANTVQFRNIYWISCNLLLFATTFYLLAALFFLDYLEGKGKQRYLASFMIALAGVLLTKEDLVTFPVTALMISGYLVLSRKGSIGNRDFSLILRPGIIFWSIPFLFVGYRTVTSMIFGGREECPYNLFDCLNTDAASPHRVSFLGFHIFENLARQWFWNIGSFGAYWVMKPFSQYAGFFEWRSLGGIEYVIVLGSLTGLFLLYWVVRRSISWWYLIIGVIWFIGGLSPTMILPEYSQTYFSAFPAIGLFMAVVIPLRAIMSYWNIGVTRVAVTGLMMIFLMNSLYWMRWNEPVNPITKSSAILQQLEKDVKKIYPVFPSHTNLGFLNLGNWWLGYNIAPKVMYNDFTLNVFSGEDFLQRGGKIYSKKEGLDKTNTHIFLKTSQGFREVTPAFFKEYGGVIQ